MINFLIVFCQVLLLICGVLIVRELVFGIMDMIGMRYFIYDKYGWREVPEEVYRKYRGKKLARAIGEDE